MPLVTSPNSWDALCASEASGNLTGTFIALYSTSTTSAIDRIIASNGGSIGTTNWYRADDVQLTASVGDLATGALMASPNVGASSTSYLWPGNSWSGAAAPGTTSAVGESCSDWTTTTGTGLTGTTAYATSEWFDVYAYSCNYTFNLICVQSQ